MERKQRVKMPASQRAKQFMPFAAVKGLEKAIAEQDQLLNRVHEVELGEEQVKRINEKLNLLKKGNTVSICFYKDGYYCTHTGIVDRFDPIRREILVEGVRIVIENIIEVNGE